AQRVTEAFVVDMDDAMREMTFSDLAVPREVERATAALLDRHKAYLAALAAQDDFSLQQAIATQLAYLGPASIDAKRLAEYVRSGAAVLAEQPGAQVLAGVLAWPSPAGEHHPAPSRPEKGG